MSKKEVNIKGHVDLAQAIAYLEDLVISLKSGTICVQNCEDYVTLNPASGLEMEVEAKHKGEKESLTIVLNWQTQKEETEKRMELRISSTQPVTAGATDDEDEDD
ncbi:MAG: hypothetical protein HJJLKODD_02793 [Phycisphaerae bacterium]|nr:hypothetical protein [Phycisphaerae bacterium]